MCGIAGIVSLRQQPVPELRRRLETMNNAIAHRGPDGAGVWVDGTNKIGFAHRRLAIIDLNETSAQPMIDHVGRVLTYNGEIYNYIELHESLSPYWPFAGQGDTECILAGYDHYGIDTLDHFRGMFSFGLWDPVKSQFMAAVDRFGIKPFYYAEIDDVFYFASEIKALLPFLPEVATDPLGLSEYISFQLPISEATLFKYVKRLLPGHRILINDGNVKVERYWDVKYEHSQGHDPQYYYDRARDLIDDSVAKHLRSDVPVGSYLSGGVDSGLIATLAADHDAGSGVCFHGKFTDYPGYDESHHAEAIAKKSGLELHQMTITADDFKDNISDIIYYLDHPIAGPGSFPQYMVSGLAKQHVKVVLGGQGGDELFGGYARYLVGYLEALIKAGLEDRLDEPQYEIGFAELAPNLALLGEYKPMLKSFWKQGLFETLDRRYYRLCDRSADMVNEINPDAIDKDHAWNVFSNVFNNTDNIPGKQPFDSMTHFDLKCLLPGLLQVEDRMSMAHGIESRVPLIDPEIVEFSATIPTPIKYGGGEMKHILKSAFGDRLPQSIVNRRDKMGFPVPLKEWYASDLSDFMQDTFTSRSAMERDIINADKVLENVKMDQPFSRKTWGLLSLELWHQRFHDQSSKIRFQSS